MIDMLTAAKAIYAASGLGRVMDKREGDWRQVSLSAVVDRSQVPEVTRQFAEILAASGGYLAVLAPAEGDEFRIRLIHEGRVEPEDSMEQMDRDLDRLLGR